MFSFKFSKKQPEAAKVTAPVTEIITKVDWSMKLIEDYLTPISIELERLELAPAAALPDYRRWINDAMTYITESDDTDKRKYERVSRELNLKTSEGQRINSWMADQMAELDRVIAIEIFYSNRRETARS